MEWERVWDRENFPGIYSDCSNDAGSALQEQAGRRSHSDEFMPKKPNDFSFFFLGLHTLTI